MVGITAGLSVFSTVLQNCIMNRLCKKELSTNDHIYRFNTIMYAVCVLLLGIGLIGERVSLYTVVLGIAFGVVTALSNLYKMVALTSGPMHITLLITTSSMIIPTMSGIFFGEQFSTLKLLFVIVLIGFIYLSMDQKDDAKWNKRWLVCCILAFLFQGSIGVLQKIHQSSDHRAETNGFLLTAFICSVIYSLLRTKKSYRELSFGKTHVILAVVCGMCTYCMNVLNLKLSGILSSQLFFPLINGRAIVLTSVMSVFVFKEKPTKRQLIGLCGGIAALVTICLVQ